MMHIIPLIPLSIQFDICIVNHLRSQNMSPNIYVELEQARNLGEVTRCTILFNFLEMLSDLFENGYWR